LGKPEACNHNLPARGSAGANQAGLEPAALADVNRQVPRGFPQDVLDKIFAGASRLGK